jgi:hypothetical protein
MLKVLKYIGCILMVLCLGTASGVPVMADPAPDLTCQLEFSEIYTGIANKVIVVVPDPGDSVASFQVKLEVDDGDGYTEIATNDVSWDFTWGDATTTFTWTPSASGNHTLRAIVDPDNDVTEDNEGNNQDTEVVIAGPVTAKTVNVRIEGKTSTVWSGEVTFTTSTITDKNGDTCTLNYPTAIGAIHAASAAGGFSLVIDSMFSPVDYVESVDGEAASGFEGWMYRANWASPNLGAKEYALSDGDTILWMYTAWGARPLRTTVTSDSVLYGGSFTATVEAYDGTAWSPVQGVTLYFGTSSNATDADGQIKDLTLNPGLYTVYADSGDYTQYIRSNKETVLVYVTLDLKPGWNFISVPKKLATGYYTAEQLFGSVNTAGHSIFRYDPSGGWTAMSSGDVVSPLDGIWIYSATAVELQPAFDTNPRQVPPTKQLSAGWNAIGFSDFTDASADSALTSVEDKWAILIGFNSDAQSYDISIINNAPSGDSHSEDRNMELWKGYWLHMTQSGELAGISS